MKEFFGIGGYTREPEGYMSWQHLLFVTSLMVIMTVMAVFFGRQNRNRTAKEKNRVLVISAILIDAFELLKITILCSQDPSAWRVNLPLFFCSIQLITIPMAAFCRGRAKEAALDFVSIFGVLGALLGTYTATQNYSCYPVLSFDNVVSGITHSISGFAALYIMISGMTSMKKRNIWITISIMFSFAIAAYVANILLDYNYMFLMRSDGTPYELLNQVVGGVQVLYSIGVVLLFVIYIFAYNGIYNFFKEKKSTVSN